MHEDLLNLLFAAAVQFSGLTPLDERPPVTAMPYPAMLRELCAGAQEESRRMLAQHGQCIRLRAMRPDSCGKQLAKANAYGRCMSQRGLVAAYIIGEGRIVYRDDLDLSEDADNSFIVHEFVHALQDQHRGGHAFESCADTLAAERDAYRAQQSYLRSRGLLFSVGQRLRYVRCQDLL